MNTHFFPFRNGSSVAQADIPVVPFEIFRDTLTHRLGHGPRLCALLAQPTIKPNVTRLLALIAYDATHTLALGATDITGASYPSLTHACPQAHLFERAIFEDIGLRPDGHPWLKPVRKPNNEFYRVDGEGIHEVAVGPVHAGVIEPGHFRFQCSGEIVHHLEIALGYQHRGVASMLLGGPNAKTRHLIETASGDATVAHATAYATVIEALANATPTRRENVLRAIALELERLACHIGDIGALAGDVGFLPTASYCGRIRGDFLNMTALLCGNRFGRGLIRPFGQAADYLDDARAARLAKRLDEGARDATQAIALLWDTPSACARFEHVGIVTKRVAEELGLVGPCARASGITIDARRDFPLTSITPAELPQDDDFTAAGDVFSRAYIRWREIQQSIAFIHKRLAFLPPMESPTPATPLASDRLAIALVEGWRGEVCHVARTDAQGRFADYQIIDPSFYNWPGLAHALRNQEISDFPINNKSFNLSYCGFDL